MQITTPEDFREIIPDAPDVPVSQVTWAERELLNRQSGFNRSLLEAHETCGCFHCGRRFPTSLVTEWMAEDGQEDTGICPYCGTDALIVGTADIPLSTSLLTRLYEEWFGRELKEREYDPHLLAPPYGNHDDYLRKGIPLSHGDGRGGAQAHRTRGAAYEQGEPLGRRRKRQRIDLVCRRPRRWTMGLRGNAPPRQCQRTRHKRDVVRERLRG